MNNKRDVYANQLDPRITGLTTRNPFSPTNSPSRGMLELAQLKNSITLRKPEKPIIMNGIGRELLKGNMGIRLPKGSRVINIHEYSVHDNIIETSVIYYNPVNDEIEQEVIKSFEKNDKWFGFEHRPTETFDNLKPGDTFKEEVELTRTPSNVDGEECVGLNLNVAWIPHPGAAEDAMIISDSCQQRFEYSLFDTKSFTYTENRVPTNTYGNDKIYKPFPHPGETVRADGILANLRQLRDDNYLSMFNTKAMQEIDEDFDEAIRVRHITPKDPHDRLQKVIVKDVRVYYIGDKHLGQLGKGLKGTYEQIEHYHNAYLRYIDSIIETVDTLEDEYPGIKVSDTLHVDYVSYKMYQYRGPRKTWNREPLGIWKVDITLEYIMVPNVKSKITTSHGHKGIIVEVRPESEMPLDENGLRADVIIDPLGIPSRMNMGNPFEGYITSNTIVVSKEAKRLLTTEKMEVVDEYVFGYLSLINEEGANAYWNSTEKERVQYIEDGLRFILSISNTNTPYIVSTNIMNSKYAMTVNKFWIFDNGEKKLVKSPIAMQTNYIILLYKIGDDWLASPNTYVNMLGIPVAASKRRKSIIPVNNTPVKLSIAEGRMYPAFMSKEAMVEFRDRATNPVSQRLACRAILNADKPMNIKRIIDRDEHPFGGDIPLIAMKTLYQTFGEDIVFEREVDED